MPTSLPVPSKGALRALRHLAFGASCTVAVSAGLLTEDRRRRINTAREVHSNAKKLRSARQYHTAGAASIDTFEEQALKYGDDAFWLPSNVFKNTENTVQFGGELSDRRGQDGVVTNNLMPSHSPHRRIPMIALPAVKPTITLGSERSGLSSVESSSEKHSESTNPAMSFDKLSFNDVQAKQDLLPSMVASSDFLKDFKLEPDPVTRSLSQESVDMAVSLQDTNRKQGRLDLCDQIFDTVLSQGILSERQFHLFDPEDVLSRLITCPDGEAHPDPVKVEKAASIFLTELTEESRVMNWSMFSLGRKICSETFHLQMDNLVRKLVFRMERRRGDRPPPCVQQLIRATHRQGMHKHVIRYFRNFFCQTCPSQQEFFEFCKMAVKSALEVQRLDLAEKVLMSASDLAQKEKLLMSSSFLFPVLEYDWRLNHNINETRALFTRLETVVKALRNPQEAYALVIRYCVIARDEKATKFYHDQVQQMYDQGADNAQMYGHFALAKAYREDWNGVLENFHRAHKALARSEDLSHQFTPILQEYAKSHSLTEVEEYVGLFTITFGLKINKYMMNVMVSLYARAKEIDSISRWIDHAVTDGCEVDAHTINVILRNCYYQWQFSFQEVMQLFLLIEDKSGGSVKLHDKRTMVYLRQIALKGRKPAAKMHRLKRYDKHSIDRGGVYRSMSATYAKENFFLTLKIYQRALERQTLLDQIHLSLAVRASLKYHEGDVEEATRFIKEAKQRHLPIRGAISIVFVHQITKLSGERVPFTRLVQVCHNTIAAFENAGIEVPIGVITHTASCLHRRGFPGRAIDLWNSMCSRLKLPLTALDLASLTSLLNAYISLQDPAGVRWVVRMISVNRLYPDKHFRMLLRYARKNTTRMIQSQPCSDQVHEFLDSISESLDKVRDLRAGAIEEQEDVKTKIIMIVQKAIDDEKAKASMSQQGGANSHETKPRAKNAADSGHGNEANVCVSDGRDNIHDVDMPSDQLAST